MPGDDSMLSGEHSAGTTPESRAGTDTRQRGWFWHWNGIVTQYSPLIGLKGVGLLNSYTVWTDRREQSPTRGYAFPGQQAEAAFYGEDRAELITINKILVALDLIEIRKEMVQKIDPQGRRWRVPHNLYRVKDRPDGIELRTEDVLRVAELAARDAAVFRYVRRVFSERFVPIDRDNVWHRILDEVAGNQTWQQLAAKTARIEERASARSRAGHKARAGQPATKSATGSPDSTIAPEMTTGHSHNDALPETQRTGGASHHHQTSVASGNNGLHDVATSVEPTNNGSGADVEPTNTGLQGREESSAETTNNGQPSIVAPGNTTYHQEISTTTTTTTSASTGNDNIDSANPLHPEASPTNDHPTFGSQNEINIHPPFGPYGLDHHTATLPAGAEPGTERPGESTPERSAANPAGWGPLVDPCPLVVSLFEAANSRPASPLERILLGELERDAATPAAATGETGADWIVAALREAVASGSTFVAPKRIQEIINRWASEGGPSGIARTSAGTPDATTAGQLVRLPRGRNADKLWQQVLAELAGVLDADSHRRLFDGSRISGYRNGEMELEVSAAVEAKLSAEYRSMVERRLTQQLRREITVRFVGAPDSSSPPSEDPDRVVISRSDAEQSRQLWRVVLAGLDPAISAEERSRIAGSLPLGQDPDGTIVIGASSALAVRLLNGRCQSAIESALRPVLGESHSIRVVEHGRWSIEPEAGNS